MLEMLKGLAIIGFFIFLEFLAVIVLPIAIYSFFKVILNK